jgi:hypothetical protein
MSRGSIWLTVATIGIMMWGLSGPAPAQSQSSASLHCPAGYWLMGSLCMNSETGDVVNAE